VVGAENEQWGAENGQWNLKTGNGTRKRALWGYKQAAVMLVVVRRWLSS